jgi:hypothetical protein
VHYILSPGSCHLVVVIGHHNHSGVIFRLSHIIIFRLSHIICPTSSPDGRASFPGACAD